MGYFISLIAEYALHRWFLHATPERHKFLQDMGLYLKPQDDATRDHLMHHRELSAVGGAKNYVKRYSDKITDPDVQRDLVPQLLKMGFVDEVAQKNYVQDTKHATTLAKRVNVVGHFIMLPIGFIAGWVVGGGTPFLSAIAGSVFATSFMHYVAFNHPQLHLTREQILAESNAFERWYFDSEFFRSVSRFHYMHHVRSNTNFHIMPGGFDWLFRSKKSPSVIDLLEMMEADLMF